jgi:nitrite reductase/ring-hydroxylating ferredoxin subunit
MSEPDEIGRIPIAELEAKKLVRLPRAPYHVAVAWVDGCAYAIEDACPHSGVSLSTGTLRGHRIRCPGHDWDIDVRTGDVVIPALGLSTRCFTASREGDHVVVRDPARRSP